MKVTDLKENEAICCLTQEDAQQIQKLLHEAGLKWVSGESYKDKRKYNCPMYFRPHYGSMGHMDDRCGLSRYIFYPSFMFTEENISKEKPSEENPTGNKRIYDAVRGDMELREGISKLKKRMASVENRISKEAMSTQIQQITDELFGGLLSRTKETLNQIEYLLEKKKAETPEVKQREPIVGEKGPISVLDMIELAARNPCLNCRPGPNFVKEGTGCKVPQPEPSTCKDNKTSRVISNNVTLGSGPLSSSFKLKQVDELRSRLYARIGFTSDTDVKMLQKINLMCEMTEWAEDKNKKIDHDLVPSGPYGLRVHTHSVDIASVQAHSAFGIMVGTRALAEEMRALFGDRLLKYY